MQHIKYFKKGKNVHSEKSIVLNGEIVEIIDESGNQKAKILTAPQYLEVVLERNAEFHLGEKVLLDTEILVKKIESLI